MNLKKDFLKRYLWQDLILLLLIFKFVNIFAKAAKSKSRKITSQYFQTARALEVNSKNFKHIMIWNFQESPSY